MQRPGMHARFTSDDAGLSVESPILMLSRIITHSQDGKRSSDDGNPSERISSAVATVSPLFSRREGKP